MTNKKKNKYCEYSSYVRISYLIIFYIMFSNDQTMGKCKRRSSLNVDTCEQSWVFKDKKYA